MLAKTVWLDVVRAGRIRWGFVFAGVRSYFFGLGFSFRAVASAVAHVVCGGGEDRVAGEDRLEDDILGDHSFAEALRRDDDVPREEGETRALEQPSYGRTSSTPEPSQHEELRGAFADRDGARPDELPSVSELQEDAVRIDVCAQAGRVVDTFDPFDRHCLPIGAVTGNAVPSVRIASAGAAVPRRT